MANPRQLRLIAESSGKNHQVDAGMLAQLARMDPSLLHPISRGGQETELYQLTIQVRAALADVRTKLINTVRELVKPELPDDVQEVIGPLLERIEALTVSIEEQDRKIEAFLQ